MEGFRFSPRPNKADQIEWRPWGEAAFVEARTEERPILLSISAIWCHWCHVMDETTFSDDEVIQGLNRSYVPVRVDNDQRPDINRRYNMGGWPSVAFLTPEGDIITGATYVPPHQFRQLLERVQEVWDTRRDDIRKEVDESRRRLEEAQAEPAPADLSESVVARALAPVYAAFDQEFGGFGEGMKFPRTDSLDALLLQADTRPGQDAPREILTRTLDGMREGELWDPVEGGFFRYATRRDWSVPHYEKMLEDNASLVRIYARAAVLLDRPDFLDTAQAGQSYLDRRLWQPEPEAYGGSQDADEEYYRLATADERGARPAPYVDPNTYADWNARVVRGLVALATAGGEQRYLEQAVRLGETLLRYRTTRSLFSHSRTGEQLDSLLGDQVGLLEAFLDLAQATGDRRWLDETVGLADAVRDYFQLPGHLLVSDLGVRTAGSTAAEGDRFGRLRYPDQPAAENARLAAVLATLGRITRADRRMETARQMLGVLSNELDSLGDFGAEVARGAIVVLREPVHITVVGRRGAEDSVALLEEAVRVPRLHLIVDVLDPASDDDLLASTGLSGDGSGAQAYVCVGDRCLEPVTTAEDLRDQAAGVMG